MGWLDASFTYKSGNTPKYKIGDNVYKILAVLPKHKADKVSRLQKFCVECEVTNVSTKKSGFIFREFTYTVKMLKNGEVVENVYESELYSDYQKLPVLDKPELTLEELLDMLDENPIKEDIK